MTSRYAPNEAVCPVELEILGLLLRSPGSRVSEIVDDLDETRRAELASFCFQRSHMREIGILIAARCSERSLRAAGGIVGEMLTDQWQVEPEKSRKRTVTLARAA